MIRILKWVVSCTGITGIISVIFYVGLYKGTVDTKFELNERGMCDIREDVDKLYTLTKKEWGTH